MLAPDILKRGGSKLETTRALLDHPRIPVPVSAWKYYGDDHAPLLRAFEEMRKPVIVRGSHENDHHGYIGVVPTVQDVTTKRDLELAISHIEYVCASEDMRIHAQEWDMEYDPAVHILMQEQSPSHIIGSMLRNPHTGKLHIQYFDRTLRESKNIWERHGGVVEHAVVDRLGMRNFSASLEIQLDEIAQLVEIYEDVEKADAVDQSYAQHVEFGLRPHLIYQAKPFLPFAPAQDFHIPVGGVFDKKSPPRFWSTDAFGITPPEGIELPYAIVDSFQFNSDGRFTDANPYGLIQVHKSYAPCPTAKRTKGMKAYVPTAEEHHFLFHGSYRFMKLAGHSMIAPLLLGPSQRGSRLEPEDVAAFSTARLFSNGSQAVLIPSQYL